MHRSLRVLAASLRRSDLLDHPPLASFSVNAVSSTTPGSSIRARTTPPTPASSQSHHVTPVRNLLTGISHIQHEAHVIPPASQIQPDLVNHLETGTHRDLTLQNDSVTVIQSLLRTIPTTLIPHDTTSSRFVRGTRSGSDSSQCHRNLDDWTWTVWSSPDLQGPVLSQQEALSRMMPSLHVC